MSEISVSIEYKGFRKLTPRDVLMAMNDYFKHNEQSHKMEITTTSTPGIDAVAELDAKQRIIDTLTAERDKFKELYQIALNGGMDEVKAQAAEIERLRAALEEAEKFISNGVEFGYYYITRTRRLCIEHITTYPRSPESEREMTDQIKEAVRLMMGDDEHRCE